MTGKDRDVPPAQMVEAAANEIDLTFAQGPASTGEKRDHLTQRIGSAMAVAQASRSAELGSGMPFLATVGSIATFVGLFGTVWGIMYSFIGIAQSKSTNLAVVAPGIAEALLATAIGLFAAIPAVVFYNIFSRRIAAYNQRLDSFSSELLIRVSRQLDQAAG
jgi:biopolymer transport protein ExbB